MPADDRESREPWQEIEARFGLVPAFFEEGAPAAGVPAALFAMARATYLDSPLPSLFKEILFTHLARYSEVRYCSARHYALLRGSGYVAGDPSCPPLPKECALALLAEPAPSADELPAHLSALEALPAPLADWPDLLGPMGRSFRTACTVVLLERHGAKAWIRAIQRLLGPERHEWLLAFFAFVRCAMLWSELHPDLQVEPDAEALLRREPEAARLLHDGSLGAELHLRGTLQASERLRAEAELRRSAHRDAFRVALGDGLRALSSPGDIQSEACRLLGEHLGADRVFYAPVTADEVALVSFDYVAGGVRRMAGRHRLDAVGAVVGATLRSGRTLVHEDVRTLENLSPAEQAAYAALPVVAQVKVPLLVDGRLCAFLAVHQATPRAWTDDEVALIEEAAQRTSSAVERAKAEIALRDSEAALRAARQELEGRVAQRTAQLAAMNAKLREESTAREDLLRRLMAVQEEEQSRLSRDLHDHTGQLLAGLALTVRAVELSGGLRPVVAEGLAEVRRVADQVGKQIHALAVRLRPAALDDLGLEAALVHLSSEWSERSGVSVDLQAADIGRLPPEVETVLYRVVQEALTNVARHAKARTASVVVRRDPGLASAIVEDDGVGFDAEGPSKRLGLIGMRERVELAGGTLQIETWPTAGTTVIARVPLPTERSPR